MKPAGRKLLDGVANLVNAHPWGALALYVMTLAALFGAAGRSATSEWIDTDIYSLLGHQAEHPMRQSALERIRSLAERQQTWLVQHPSREVARAAALALTDRLSATDLVSLPEPGPSLSEVVAFYADYPFRIADDASLEVAEAADSSAFVERVMRTLYGSAAGLAAVDLQRDPFLLQASFLAALARTPAPFELDGRLLATRLDGRWLYVVPVMLTRSAFDLDYQRALSTFMDGLGSDLAVESPASVTSVGALDFAVANRRTATAEIGVIGTLSILLIAALILGSFRAVRPSLAIGFTLVTSVAAGVLASIAVFGSVHLLTLVAGTSLLGISVDYAFHLLASSYHGRSDSWTPAEGLRQVGAALTLGLATSLLGLTGLSASGFSGLQQIAVFSGSGLLSAYLGLWLCYPALLGPWRPTANNPLLRRLARGWVRNYRPPKAVLYASASLAVSWLYLLPPDTSAGNIRLLAAKSPEIDQLLARSQLLSELLVDNRFVLVTAASPESLLEREEQLRPVLLGLQNDGTISHFMQISRFVPSLARQQQALALNQRLLLDPGTAIDDLAERIGLRRDIVDRLRGDLARVDEANDLTIEDWLESPLAGTAGLYLGRQGDRYGSVTTLAGITDVARLQAAVHGLPDVALVDNVADVSALFTRYVDRATIGLGIAFALVAVLVLARYGFREGCVTMLVPVTVCAITLVLLELAGQPLSLFHVVGLALVLGTGMDYVFFLKAGRRSSATMLAVMLAAATTECAFGLLGFSRLGAISSFGLTIAIGTAANFLLAPVVAGGASTADPG